MVCYWWASNFFQKHWVFGSTIAPVANGITSFIVIKIFWNTICNITYELHFISTGILFYRKDFFFSGGQWEFGKACIAITRFISVPSYLNQAFYTCKMKNTKKAHGIQKKCNLYKSNQVWIMKYFSIIHKKWNISKYKRPNYRCYFFLSLQSSVQNSKVSNLLNTLNLQFFFNIYNYISMCQHWNSLRGPFRFSIPVVLWTATFLFLSLLKRKKQ